MSVTLIGTGAGFALLGLAGLGALIWMMARPRPGTALAASLSCCLAVSVPWAALSAVTSGPVPARWWGSPGRLLSAAAGSSPAAFAGVNGGITLGCFLLAGLRAGPARKKGGR